MIASPPPAGGSPARRALGAPGALRLIACLGILPPATALGGPTIAVMPFKNLSSTRASVGEAIRETVTSDLRALGGVKVIERAFIDKIVAEQNLQAQKTDLDPTSTIRIGKLLGAQLIAAGAYQEVGRKVRLTARFVSVESGQIVGSTKVDGEAGEFLALQDRITADLLRSAGIETPQARAVAKRTRPRVRSLKTLELYGDALLAADDGKRRDYLTAALAQDPDFTYAARDLEELERRLQTYDAAHSAETERSLQQLRARLEAEKDPQRAAMTLQQMLAQLAVSRHYRQQAAFCRWVIGMPNPPPSTPGYATFPEQAAMYLVTALAMVNDWDGVLREGEKFVARYPSSMLFMTVRSQMERALTEKHLVEQGVEGARAEVASLSPADQANPCRTVAIHSRQRQWPVVRRTLESMKPGQCDVYNDEFQWYQYGMAIGDFALARKAIERIKPRDPGLHTSLHATEMAMPLD